MCSSYVVFAGGAVLVGSSAKCSAVIAGAGEALHLMSLEEEEGGKLYLFPSQPISFFMRLSLRCQNFMTRETPCAILSVLTTTDKSSPVLTPACDTAGDQFAWQWLGLDAVVVMVVLVPVSTTPNLQLCHQCCCPCCLCTCYSCMLHG